MAGVGESRVHSAPQSAVWHRVADLKPRLRGHVAVEPREYRGEQWYVLQDQCTSRHFRFTPEAWFLIARMDGGRTLQQIWDAACEEYGEEEAASQEELIHLLARLHNADILHCDVPPDVNELFHRHQATRSTERKRRYMNPLSPRWSLFDPDRLLQRALPVVKPLLSWQFAVIWLALVVTAALLAVTHGSELGAHIAETTLAPQNWILIWLCFPVVKALHELGHAFVTRAWGGEVHSMGVALLVLTPVPFVDASAASAFPEKRRRILVGAAGIMVELLLASLAVFLWLLVEPGTVRDIAAVVIFIAGISTVLFNANPLLKFDGYHMLVDAIETPNLASRAGRYYGYLVQRYGFGLESATSPASTSGERAWFACYGFASFFFRLFIAFSISLFIAGKFFFIGVILAAWVAISMVLLPLFKMLAFLLTSPRIARHRVRAVTTSLAAVVAVTSVVCFMPMPFWTRVDGVVWMPDNAQVRAGVAGNITELLVAPGQRVEADTELFVSEDPFLSYQVEILEAQTLELEKRYQVALSEDRIQSEIVAEELTSKRAELEQARQKVSKLVARAPTAGTFIVPGAQDLPGRFVKQGALLGYVASSEATNVQVVISQADIALVRSATHDVQIMFNSRLDKPVPAKIERQTPAANFYLPSKVLGSEGGGKIIVDPTDENGQRAQQPLFQLELALLEEYPQAYFGERVQVRFDHGSAPLAQQWYRLGRQLFLRSFGV